MKHRSTPAPEVAPAAVSLIPATKLEPDAISITQDTVIGLASSAPAGTGAAMAMAEKDYPQGPRVIDFAALIRGSPLDNCPCYTDHTVHYHKQWLLIVALLDVVKWRYGMSALPLWRYAGCAAIGGDDQEFSLVIETDNEASE